MTRHILYAYVDGSDLEDIEEVLVDRLEQFVASHRWVHATPIVVNDRDDEDEYESEDLPDWNLGLNLELPDAGAEPQGWFGDIETIAHYLGALSSELDREFILGIFDTRTESADDIFEISSASPDVGRLREIIGVADGAT